MCVKSLLVKYESYSVINSAKFSFRADFSLLTMEILDLRARRKV
jgi:hypothetical protein